MYMLMDWNHARTWWHGVIRRLALATVLSLVFSLCAPVAMAYAAPDSYACGKEEHVHGETCLAPDSIGLTLSANGLLGYNGTVYIVHQHAAACFGADGVLACPFARDCILEPYSNIELVHAHDTSCSGCTLPETRYVIVERGDAADGASDGVWSEPGVYVGGGIGGYKGTGPNADSSRLELTYHVHGDGCGEDCPLSIVVEGIVPEGGVYACGMEEHVHGDGCLVGHVLPTLGTIRDALMKACLVPASIDMIGMDTSAGSMAASGVESGSYEVSLEWIGDSKYCTLSDDGAHAEWNFEGPVDKSFVTDMNGGLHGVYDFRINIVLHDTDPEVFELKVPAVIYSRMSPDADNESIYSSNKVISGIPSGWYSEYAIDEACFLNAIDDVSCLSVEVPADGDKNKEDRCYTLRLNGTVSQNISIPVVVRAYVLSDRSPTARRCFNPDGFCELTDGDTLIIKVVDGSDRACSASMTMHGRLSGVRAASSLNGTGYKKGRVYEWTPDVDRIYGLSKAEFNQSVEDGYVFFDFGFSVSPSGWVEGRLETEISVSDGGEIVSDRLGCNGSTDVEKIASRNGSTVCFDVSHYGGLGRRAKRSAMIRPYGFYRRVLVRYEADAIRDHVSNDIVKDSMTVSCTLNAKLTSMYDDAVLTASAEQKFVAPCVNMAAGGNIYFIDGGAGNSYGHGSLLSLFEAGMKGVKDIGYWNLNGGAYRAVNDEAKLSVGRIGVLVFDPFLRDWIRLEEDDYRLSRAEVSVTLTGTPIYDTDGEIIAYDTSDISTEIMNHKVSIELMTSDRPDEWQTVRTATYNELQRDTRVGWTTENIIGIRVVDENRTVPVRITIDNHFSLGSSSERAKTLLKHLREAGQTELEYRFVDFVAATSTDGISLSNMGFVSDDFKACVSSLFSDTLKDDGYTDDLPLFKTHTVRGKLNGFDANMLLVPTLYDNSGNALGSYYTTPVVNNVSAVDWFVSSSLCMEGISDVIFDDEFPDDSVFNAERAAYRILIPDGMDVVSVKPGFCDAIEDGWSTIGTTVIGSAYTDMSWGAHRLSNFRLAADSASITYNVIENYNGTGHVVLEVTSDTPYERGQGIFDLTDDCVVFGGFTIRLEPKYSSTVMSNADLRLDVAGYAMTKDGAEIVYDKVWADYGYRDSGAYFSERNVFADLDGDGDVAEYIVAKHSYQAEILYQPLVSGTYLSVSDPVTRLSGSNVIIQPEGNYVYRMTYSQMVNRSKNVVLFDVLEDLDGNSWTGTLKSIDTSDADRQGINCVIYVNKGQLDSQAYVDSSVTEDYLSKGNDGWVVWNGLDDLSGVTAIAVGFGDQEFTKDEAGKPSMVSIKLTMTSPSVNGLYKDTNTVRNRSFYSDVLMGSSNQARTVMSNTVTVGIDPEQLPDSRFGLEMPKTGGVGIGMYFVAGMVLLVTAFVWAVPRVVRRKDGRDV